MTESFSIEDGKIVPGGESPCIRLFIGPDEFERKQLTDEYELDPHDLASALDPDELGRLEIQQDMAVLILKTPRNFTGEEQLFTVTSMGLFVKKDHLLIVTTDPVELFDDRMIHRVSDHRDALLKILYGSISHFLGHLKVINMLSESLEKRIKASMGNRYLLDMFTLEKSLVYFVNGINSNQMVLEKMKAAQARFDFSEPQRDVLDDIIIENLQCSKQADIYTNILIGLMDARSSLVNNNLNNLMKRLTIVSIIFMPLNVIAGIGGMSEFSGWTHGIPWFVAYGAFTVGLVFVAFVTNLILRKTGLSRDEDELDRAHSKLSKGGAFRGLTSRVARGKKRKA